jgi:hypothetical protein
MTTVADIAQRSCEILGVLAVGETLGTADTDICVRALSSLLDSWQLDPQAVVGLQELVYSPANGAQSVTIGASGQIVSPMPARVELSSFYRLNGVDVPIGVANSYDEIAAQASKTVTGLPQIMYLMRGNANLSTLYLWPASNGNYELHLWVPQEDVAGFSTIISSTTLTLPNGYRKALEDCLAVELITSFSVPDVVASKVMHSAAMSLRKVKRGNFTSYQIQNRVARPRPYNIRTE